MSQYWVWPVIPENWAIARIAKIWAAKHPAAAQKVRKGDKIIMYVKGASAFKGIIEVISDWYENDELIWHDEIELGEKIYPYEVRIRIVHEGTVPVREVWSELDFMRKYGLHPYLALRGHSTGPANSGKPISHRDYMIIASRMRPYR